MGLDAQRPKSVAQAGDGHGAIPPAELRLCGNVAAALAEAEQASQSPPDSVDGRGARVGTKAAEESGSEVSRGMAVDACEAADGATAGRAK
eukprot:3715228-Alexandrium_andersonii.AAC.1